MNEMPLHKLKEGDSGIVIRVDRSHCGELTAQRLEDLGVIPGTRIKCLYRSPLRDPAAYEIRGAVLALRKEDSAAILTEPAENRELAMCQQDTRGGHADLTIALAGNPNVGKSTVFNTLTGLRQHMGNWAGKTVDSASGMTAQSFVDAFQKAVGAEPEFVI